MARSARRGAVRAAIIGWGSIGREVERGLGEVHSVEVVAVLTRPGRAHAVQSELRSPARAVTDVASLLEIAPDVVLECAGHEAVRHLAVPVLEAGVDVLVVSTGAFADDDLLERCRRAATSGDARIVVPAGAIAGLDGLAALRVGGLDEVTYTSTKPTGSWVGTAAEQAVDLAGLRGPVTFFEGDARTAALAYPKNANLAMTVALAGAGPAATRVLLVADPHATTIEGRIDARGRHGTLSIRVEGPSASVNPRTSATTAHSIVATLANRVARIVV